MKNKRCITLINPQTGDEKHIKRSLNFLLFFAPFLLAIPYFSYKIPYFKTRGFIIILPSVYFTIVGFLVLLHILLAPFHSVQLKIFTGAFIAINMIIIIIINIAVFNVAMAPDLWLPFVIACKIISMAIIALFIYTVYLSFRMLIKGNKIIVNYYLDKGFKDTD